MTEEFTERIFGSAECAVLYLNPDLLKSIKARPGNRVRITPDKDGFRVQVENGHAGQPAKVEAHYDQQRDSSYNG
jgi:hypothetical protein